MELVAALMVIVVLVIALVTRDSAQRNALLKVLEHDRALVERLLSRVELQHGNSLLIQARAAEQPSSPPAPPDPGRFPSGMVVPPPGLDGE